MGAYLFISLSVCPHRLGVRRPLGATTRLGSARGPARCSTSRGTWHHHDAVGAAPSRQRMG